MYLVLPLPFVEKAVFFPQCILKISLSKTSCYSYMGLSLDFLLSFSGVGVHVCFCPGRILSLTLWLCRMV